MNLQNRLSGIRGALILVLALTLVSGPILAQTLTYYAYTSNSGFASTAKSVSEITTYNNTVTNAATLLAKPGQGIALPADNDNWAAVTETSCTGASGQECVSIVDFNCASGSGYLVTPVSTDHTANFVAITPYISSKLGKDNFAYVTTGGQYVDIVTYSSNACKPTYKVVNPPLQLPPGSAMDSPGSYGVAIANNGKDVWVTDPNTGSHGDRPYVYVIDSSTTTTQIIPLTCPANCPLDTCCPRSTPAPRHIAYASINSSTYNMYVTDGQASRAVWVVQVTLDANGNFQSWKVLAPILWPQSGDANNCNMSIGGGTVPVATYGISVNSNATTNPNTVAYVTAAINNRLFIIRNLSNANGGTFDCAPHTNLGYTMNPFVGPRGVVWIPDGRAYVGNDSANQVNVIQTDPNQTPGLITNNMPGSPLSVAVTLYQYPAPASPSSRR